jgi:hyperosmotically inducible periplasmic protein
MVIGAAALYFLTSEQGQSQLRSTGQQIDEATKAGRESLQENLKVLDLRPQDIKEELERSGQIVRRKARETGQAIADATADARITAAIKAKLVSDPDLSALSISVNTTAGVVTLSGPVDSTEDIGKAVLLAMKIDGVREVVSTLQVRPRETKK